MKKEPRFTPTHKVALAITAIFVIALCLSLVFIRQARVEASSLSAAFIFMMSIVTIGTGASLGERALGQYHWAKILGIMTLVSASANLLFAGGAKTFSTVEHGSLPVILFTRFLLCLTAEYVFWMVTVDAENRNKKTRKRQQAELHNLE